MIRGRHLSPSNQSTEACIKSVCSTAAAELDVSEWGPILTRRLLGEISILSHWWLASKKYWRQSWKGNSGSIACSGQDTNYVVISSHLGGGNLKLQSQVQGFLTHFIKYLFFLKYIKSCRLSRHLTDPRHLSLSFIKHKISQRKDWRAPHLSCLSSLLSSIRPNTLTVKTVQSVG